MLDFGAFCYLDLQRSGSTFIRDFLLRHVALPIIGDLRKHQPVFRQRGEPRDKLFFISVRQPLATYKSIYSHGLRELGGVRWDLGQALGTRRVAALYDGSAAGFQRWLELMLEPGTLDALGRPRRLAACPGGFLTWRLLRLCLYDPVRRLRWCRSRKGLTRLYRRHRLHGPVIRTETLNEDLAALIRARLAPYLLDADAALAELAAGPAPMNRSSHLGEHWEAPLPGELSRLLAAREWLYATELGYALDHHSPRRGGVGEPRA